MGLRDRIAELYSQLGGKYSGAKAKRELRKLSKIALREGDISEKEYRQLSNVTRPSTIDIPDTRATLLGKQLSQPQVEQPAGFKPTQSEIQRLSTRIYR